MIASTTTNLIWLLLVASVGCQARVAPVVRFAGGVQAARLSQPSALAPPPSWTVHVEGVSASTPRGPAIAMKIANHGGESIRLSAVVDRYFVDLSDGQTIELDEDFFRYPNQVAAGSEESVTLLLPKGIDLMRIAKIYGTIDDGRLHLMLTPQGLRPGDSTGVPLPWREQRAPEAEAPTS